MAFSPSGTLLALGRSDGNVRLVDTTTGLPVAELKGHTASVTSLAFSEDGRWLTTASSDGTIRLWGVGE
jgi:WD40 repeat protein